MAALTGNWRRTGYRRNILGRKPRPGPDAAQASAAACAAAPAPSAAEAPERCRHCSHGVVAGRAISMPGAVVIQPPVAGAWPYGTGAGNPDARAAAQRGGAG